MSINFRKTVFLTVAVTPEQCPANTMPEIVLAGRSNVGKSSFINAIADNKKLAKVSSMPGKTKMVIYFLVDKKFLFADLPGYGFAKANKEDRKAYHSLVDNYLSSGRKFSLVLHFMDARHSPSEKDKLMSDWLMASKIPYIVILSKADKLSKYQLSIRDNIFRNEMSIPPEILILPLGNKDGIDKIILAIDEFLNEKMLLK